jgi:hypothetical protein
MKTKAPRLTPAQRDYLEEVARCADRSTGWADGRSLHGAYVRRFFRVAIAEKHRKALERRGIVECRPRADSITPDVRIVQGLTREARIERALRAIVEDAAHVSDSEIYGMVVADRLIDAGQEALES